jgi:hypothetical protein
MTSLVWKVNRLRLMGMPELMWRVQQSLRKKACKLGFGLARKPPSPDTSSFGNAFIHVEAAVTDCQSVCTAADKLLSGRWNVFAAKNVFLGFPPQWNRDPKTGTDAPMTLGKEIDYRNDRVVGDIKYLWEPSRHLELVTLAMAWRLTGDNKYADGAKVLLQSWFTQCPYPNGVHWTSSLELSIRLLNWSLAWNLLGGCASPLFKSAQGEQLLEQWLDSVYQHCHFIAGYFSKYSSANNHLFGEYTGLLIASITWPCWKESISWRKTAVAGLENEAVRQNTEDGVNKEQAVYYQHEVMDMMLLSYLAGNANGITFSKKYLVRLERMAEFISSIMDVSGNVPMIGDADDALIVRLSYEREWSHYRSLLASCALLFSRSDFKGQAGLLDDKNRWLFGHTGVMLWENVTQRKAESKMAFPEGGYFLLGARFGLVDEIKAIVDCAPLGYLSIAAHGHADALAFTLSVAGEEVLIDPGTYAYHTQKRWRDYFRGTAAHNTVCIDGVDQSEIGGNFMWLTKAKARLLLHSVEIGNEQVFEGEHDGYHRLHDPVNHRRRITYQEIGRFVVTDIIECAKNHLVQIFWHFGEDCAVTVEENQLRLKTASGLVEACFSCPKLNVVLSRGSEEPVSGWVSRTFDEKKPTTTACFSGFINGSAEFETTILISTSPRTPLARDAASSSPVDVSIFK